MTATYQLTPRFSLTTDIPLLTASRHTNDSPIVYTSAGIGDASFVASGWIGIRKPIPEVTSS